MKKNQKKRSITSQQQVFLVYVQENIATTLVGKALVIIYTIEL